MVARLASIAQRYQKVAGSSPAVVIFSHHLRTTNDNANPEQLLVLVLHVLIFQSELSSMKLAWRTPDRYSLASY